MKKTLVLLGLSSISLFLFACEEDDICVDEGTPFLTVVFRNALNSANQSDTLTIYSSDNLDFQNPTLLYEKVFSDSLKLPLGTLNQSNTYFRIQRRSNPDFDLLSVHHQTISEYVSKACGFRLTYEDVSYESTQNHIDYLIPSESNQIKDESETNLYIVLGD